MAYVSAARRSWVGNTGTEVSQKRSNAGRHGGVPVWEELPDIALAAGAVLGRLQFMKPASAVPLVASLLFLTSFSLAKTHPLQSVSHDGTPTAESTKGAKGTEQSPEESEADDSDESESDDEKGAGECRQSKLPLTLTIDKKTANLEEGRVQAKLDGPICSLVMRLWRKDGTVMEKAFHYEAPEQELHWTPVPRDQIEKVEFRITAKDKAYRAVTLTPWSVSIDHEEVKFDTNKAVIRASEVPALEDSLVKIKQVLAKVEGKELGPITLFIAGHTDTRGSNEHNLTLSRERAQAIAAWFQKQGLCIGIAFEGFGETALKKLTADEVDEQANRRVDYILAIEPPLIKKGASPAWKSMSRGCPRPPQ